MIEPGASARTRIWDLPTRLFHWLVAALVIVSFTTGKLGGDWLLWHFRSGYATAALLLFRLLWGFAGPRYARFESFFPSRPRIWPTMRSSDSEPLPASAGHSSVGTLSVCALLIVLAVQVSTGVFSNDGTFIEGPLAKFVSSALSDRLSAIHYYNHWLIAGLVALHVAAIAYYLLAREEDLLTPMLTGDKLGIDAPPADDGMSVRVRGAVLMAIAGGVVAYLVTL